MIAGVEFCAHLSVSTAASHAASLATAAYCDPCEASVGVGAGAGAGAGRAGGAGGVLGASGGFVARYPTYRAKDSLLQALLRRAAVDIPRIVVTQPPGCCPRHRHLAPPP
ncbi:Protein of unknown function, partial [Gryllus bimaculatus]